MNELTVTIDLKSIDEKIISETLGKYHFYQGDNLLCIRNLTEIFSAWTTLNMKTNNFKDLDSMLCSSEEDEAICTDQLTIKEELKNFKKYLSENLYLILILAKKLDMTPQELLVDELHNHASRGVIFQKLPPLLIATTACKQAVSN
ncbi:hypothetical protein CMI37_08720 [Candidatus Pacearchaeota archaeon]|nr:hypothetical protein [Candidatus Pacearchaeota archaeon]